MPSPDDPLISLEQRASLAEAERARLEAELAEHEAQSAALIRALEEEVEALLLPSRGDAIAFYARRCEQLGRDVAAASAQRQKLEALLSSAADGRGDVDRARDAALVGAALAREQSLRGRLATAERRLGILRETVR